MDLIKLIDKYIPKAKQICSRRCMEISEQIREIMKTQKMSEKELAKKLGTSEKKISKYLSGTYDFNQNTLAEIECALNERICYTKIGVRSDNGALVILPMQ